MMLLGFALTAYAGGGVDFRAYYGAATLVLRGGNPYDYAQLSPVLEELTGSAGNSPFFYPPWFALLVTPLTLLPFQAARAAWLGLNAGLYYVALAFLREALDWQVTGWRRWLAYASAVPMFAAYCLRSEQVGILLLFGLALTLRGLKRGQDGWAGLGLAIATIKPQVTLPTIAILCLLLLARRRRVLLWAVVWSVVLLGIATVAIPSWWAFDRSGFGLGISYELDGAEQVVARRVHSTVYDFGAFVLGLGTAGRAFLAAGAGLLGLGLVVAAWLRGESAALLAAAGTILTLLITPYALQYDYVLLTGALLWCYKQMPALNRWMRCAAAALLLAAFSVLIWQAGSYEGYWQLLGVTGAFGVALLATERHAPRAGPQPCGTDGPPPGRTAAREVAGEGMDRAQCAVPGIVDGC